MPHALSRIFEPRSVAIVGASSNPRKRGYQAVRALLDAGYSGEIYPVNPAAGELFGLEVARSVAEVDGTPDLAYICTPAESVPDVLEACAAKGIPGAVVLAVGFRESGGAGAALETRVVDIARRTGIRVVGPNTSGVLNTLLGLNLVGVRGVPRGRLAIISQSGNVGLALMRQACSRSEGVSIYVGVGNETDIAFHEYLEYLADAEHTSAILMYVEGFRDGERFVEVARRVSADKPIALLKSGRSQTGSAAALSHTGAIAGSTAVVAAALESAGVHQVERADELLAIGETLAGQPAIRTGAGAVILSDGGGYAALVADALAQLGVKLAKLSPATRERLRTLLGPAANVDNPVDVAGAGDQDPGIFARALEALTEDPATGGVVMSGLFGGYAVRFTAELADQEAEAADAIAAVASRAGVPLIVQSMYAPSCPEPLQRLGRCGVPVIESLEVAAACLDAACRRGLFLDRAVRRSPSVPQPRSETPVEIVTAAAEGRTALMETETRTLIARYGVKVATATFCTDADQVAGAVRAAGVPVAIKIVSPAILHKTDAGGVVLHVSTPEEAVSAYERVVSSARAYAKQHEFEADLRGVLVAPMLPPPIAELIVGAKRDPQFGPVLTVGAGGLAVELLEDAALRVLPITAGDAEELLAGLRISPMLRGYRGRPNACIDCLVEILLGIGTCVLQNPEFSALEANPVFVYPDRAVAVDVRGLLHDIGNRPT